MATWNQNCSVSLLGFGCSCFELLLLRGGGWKTLSLLGFLWRWDQKRSQPSQQFQGGPSQLGSVCVRLHKKVSRLPPPPPFWNLHFPKYPAANIGDGSSTLFHVGGGIVAAMLHDKGNAEATTVGFNYFPERWQRNKLQLSVDLFPKKKYFKNQMLYLT